MPSAPTRLPRPEDSHRARPHRPCSAAVAVVALLAVDLRRVSADDAAKKPTSVLDFQVKDIDGKDVDLSKYKGKVLLIVNTASQCGYTPQYKGLEAIYEKYKDQGFEVLAFPANEFGHQEPGTDAEIKTVLHHEVQRHASRSSRRSSSRARGSTRSTSS